MKSFEQREVTARPSPSLGLRASLVGVAAGVLGLRLAGAGLGLASSVLIARLTDPESFGIYSLVLAGAGVMGTVASLGLPMLVTREGATALARGRSASIRILALASLLLVAAVSVLLIVPALALAAGGLIASEIPLFAFALGALLSLLLALNMVRAGLLRGIHAVVRADLPDLLLRPLALLAAAAALYFAGWTLGATGAVALQCLATVIAFLLGLGFLIRVVPAGGAPARAAPVAIDLARKSIPFWAIASLAIVEVQAPLLLLGFLSEPTEAALFAAASQVAGLIILGLVSVIAPLQGRLAATWAVMDRENSQRLAAQGARVGFLMAVPAVVLLALVPESVLRWFGEEYVTGAMTLRVLLIGLLVNAVLGPCRISLAICGQQALVLWGVTAAVLLGTIVAVLTIPVFGAEGAAIAASIARAFWNVLFVILCWLKLGLRTDVLHRGAWDFARARDASLS